MKEIEWTIPIHTVSESNCSEHWSKKKKRHDLQKRWIKVFFLKERPQVELPCTITLTRMGKRNLDSDNLPASMKWVRDSIADHLIPGKASGQADNDPRIEWKYAQEISKEQNVKIKFE